LTEAEIARLIAAARNRYGHRDASWRTLLIAAMGEELREDEREIFTQLTGREREPSQVSTNSPP
jgi:hypothetical protein